MKKICLIIFLIFATVLGESSQAEESAIQIYFLNPLKQKKPENSCKTEACKVLLKNINSAQESIDFAIYGINEQDKIFNALIKAQKRGVKVRWVTDLNEDSRNIYYDTYKLMHKIPTYKTDYFSQQKEIEALKKEIKDKTKNFSNIINKQQQTMGQDKKMQVKNHHIIRTHYKI